MLGSRARRRVRASSASSTATAHSSARITVAWCRTMDFGNRVARDRVDTLDQGLQGGFGGGKFHRNHSALAADHTARIAAAGQPQIWCNCPQMRAFAWFLGLILLALAVMAALTYPAWQLLHPAFGFPFHRVADRLGMITLAVGFFLVARRLRLADRDSLGFGLPPRQFLREAGHRFRYRRACSWASSSRSCWRCICGCCVPGWR